MIKLVEFFLFASQNYHYKIALFTFQDYTKKKIKNLHWIQLTLKPKSSHDSAIINLSFICSSCLCCCLMPRMANKDVGAVLMVCTVQTVGSSSSSPSTGWNKPDSVDVQAIFSSCSQRVVIVAVTRLLLLFICLNGLTKSRDLTTFGQSYL